MLSVDIVLKADYDYTLWFTATVKELISAISTTDLTVTRRYTVVDKRTVAQVRPHLVTLKELRGGEPGYAALYQAWDGTSISRPSTNHYYQTPPPSHMLELGSIIHIPFPNQRSVLGISQSEVSTDAA